MSENLFFKKNSIIFGIIVVVILGFGYGGYSFLQSLSTESSSSKLDQSLLSPDLKAFYAVRDKIKLTKKDMAFMEKSFYKTLQDNTVEFPPAIPTGRPNPFWAP